jgi:hypothetical protein
MLSLYMTLYIPDKFVLFLKDTCVKLIVHIVFVYVYMAHIFSSLYFDLYEFLYFKKQLVLNFYPSDYLCM